MGSYARTYNFTNGTVAYGDQIVYEFDAIASSVNNIVNDQISSGAAIADSKLATISTAGKVSGDAITLLTSLPSGAGVIPLANLPVGTVVQTVYGEYRTSATTSTVLPADNSVPQITEGVEFLTCAITPKSATNKLLITALAHLTVNAGNGGTCTMALFNTDFHSTNAIATGHINDSANAGGYGASGYAVIQFYMDAGVTTASTFRLRYGSAAAYATAINSDANYAAIFNGNLVSSIAIQEIKV